MATSRTTRARQSQNAGALAENKGNGKLPVFDLDAYQAEATREPFAFTLGGQQFTLPHLLDMDWHVGIGEDGSPAEPTIHSLLRAALGDQFKTFDKLSLTAAGYNELWKRWQDHSGVEVGESGASPAS